MKLLLIKTSSMGDVIHTLPALTDAKKAIPSLSVDWVVEEGFQAIPKWHDSVNRIVPVSLRRWRHHLFTKKTWQEWCEFYRALRETEYDVILDAQGLLKSALLTRLGRSKHIIGLDSSSAREPCAHHFYHQKVTVDKTQHAITRLRQLFCSAFNYALPDTPIDYGISKRLHQSKPSEAPYVVFLHGTTWASKEWPENYWCQLALLAVSAGWSIKLSGGNDFEIARANRIASVSENIIVLPRLSIEQMADLLSSATAAVAVDTGFAHLAAALNKPLIALFGATSGELTGTIGINAKNLIATSPSCTPCLKRHCHYTLPSLVTPACYEALTPERVWAAISASLS